MLSADGFFLSISQGACQFPIWGMLFLRSGGLTAAGGNDHSEAQHDQPNEY
jgi:hypothetical protein